MKKIRNESILLWFIMMLGAEAVVFHDTHRDILGGIFDRLPVVDSVNWAMSQSALHHYVTSERIFPWTLQDVAELDSVCGLENRKEITYWYRGQVYNNGFLEFLVKAHMDVENMSACLRRVDHLKNMMPPMRSRSPIHVRIRATSSTVVPAALGVLSEAHCGAVITHLDLYEIGLKDQDFELIGKILSTDTNLRHLNLRQLSFESHGISAGVISMLSSLAENENSGLLTLDLSENVIGDGGAVALAAVLAKNIPLQHIGVRGCLIREFSAEIIANSLKYNTHLLSMDISNNRALAHGARAFAHVLQHFNSNLRRLVMENNDIKADGAVALANALTANHHLQTLNLRNNDIDTAGAVLFFQALTKNEGLVRLNLEQSSIHRDAADSLANVLRVHPKLKGLDLRYNKLGSHGATTLSKALIENNILELLDLGYNEIGESGLTDLASALSGRDAGLRDLSLTANSGSVGGIRALAKMLRTNRCLQKLSLDNTRTLDTQGAIELAHALEENNTLQSLQLAFNAIGRSGIDALKQVVIDRIGFDLSISWNRPDLE